MQYGSGLMNTGAVSYFKRSSLMLMLANVCHPGVQLANDWVSEKYDGVRGFWNGRKLLTRGGQTFNALAWFTAHWPATRMDGKL